MKRFLVLLLVFALLINTVAFAAPEMAGTVESSTEVEEERVFEEENTTDKTEDDDVLLGENKKGSDFSSNSYIADKLDDLFELLPYGSYPYFTTYGDKGCGNNSCSYCNAKNVVNQHPSLKDLGLNSSKVSGYTCFGFAQFAYYFIFGIQAGEYGTHSQQDNLSTLDRVFKLQSYSVASCKEAFQQARAGDIIQGHGQYTENGETKNRVHSMIYLGPNDSNSFWVIDNNWSSDGKVKIHTVTYEYFTNRWNTSASVYTCPDEYYPASSAPEKDDFDGRYKTYYYDANKTKQLHAIYTYKCTWQEAKALCESYGGHLVTINNAEEQSAVANMAADADGTMWIGAYRDSANTASYKWVTGETFDYTNWDDGEPSGVSGENTELYVGIYGNDVDSTYATFGKWNDFSETTSTVDGFICEWEPYEVTYNANGGIGAPASQTQFFDESLTLSSSVPTKTGYVFKGWSTSNDSTVEYAPGATYTANEDVTLYAVWTANTYMVTYNPNGGSTAAVGRSVVYGSTYGSHPIPTRTGYTFKGWYTSASEGTRITSDSTVNITADHTLYAHWTANTYTVSYNANGGSGAPESQTKTHDVALTLRTSVPTRAGGTFLGWSTTADGDVEYEPGENYTVNADVTLYAAWVIKFHTISYEFNGGSGSPAAIAGAYGRTLEISTNVPTKSGYEFVGWSSNNTGTVDYQPGDKVYNDRDRELVAVWQKTDNSDVVFSADNESMMYHFSGVNMCWPVKDDSTGETYYQMRITNSTNPLIAFPYERFEAENYKFMIVDFSVEADEGFDEKMSIYFKNDVYTELNEAKTFKYSFKSSTEKTRHNVIFDLSDNEYWTGLVDYVRFDPTSKSTGTVKLYSITFTDDISYSVNFDLNGGSGNIPSQVKSHDTALTLDSTIPTKTGYTFLGWATSANGEVEYASGASYTANEDVTLYAVWKQDEQPTPDTPDIDPDAPKVLVSSVKTKAGKRATVNVSIENNPGIAALQFSVAYDPKVLSLVNATDENSEVRLAATLNPDFSKYPYVVNFYRASNDSSNGILFTMEFDVNPDAPVGVYDIELIIEKSYDQYFADVEFAAVKGSVTVIDVALGDANGDTEIDLRDVVLLAQYCAGWDSAKEIAQADALDANADGEVDIRDLVLLAQFCAGWGVTLG